MKGATNSNAQCTHNNIYKFGVNNDKRDLLISNSHLQRNSTQQLS